MIIDDFINNFNKHRAAFNYPSEKICVDESISRWYGLGGSWIDVGLPTYAAMERKPENGCEIQNAVMGKVESCCNFVWLSPVMQMLKRVMMT
jgi:hypothetical protein